MKHKLFGLVALSTVFIATPYVYAGPIETFGLGARSPAMGGAVSANASDPSANFYNPAGLAYAEGASIAIGYTYSSHTLSLNGYDSGVNPARGLSFGLIIPGRIAKIPFAFGFSTYLPDERILRIRSLEQQPPRWEMYDNRTQRLFITANVAVQLFPWLSVGAGLGFLADTRAQVNISGNVNILDPNRSELSHDINANLTSVRYPVAGLRVTPHKKLRLALVYRGQFQLQLDVSARVALQAAIGQTKSPVLTEMNATSFIAFLPQQWVAGVSFDALENLTLNADLTWVNWSAYQSTTTQVMLSNKVQLPPDLPKYRLPADPIPTAPIDPGFRDHIVPRLGVEWRVPIETARTLKTQSHKPSEPQEPNPHRYHTLAFRGGYFYEKTPVPEQPGITNFVDTDRHAFSAGAGLQLHNVIDEIPGTFSFDVYGALSLLPERVFQKSSPADFIGDYRARGHIWSLGATVGLVF